VAKFNFDRLFLTIDRGEPETVNREQRYLSTIFSELIRLGSWHKANPLANVRQIKTDQVELTFLTLDQVAQLFEECKASTNNHTYPVALLCLATGARWEETESIARGAVHGREVHFHRTKNRQSRSVPIPAELEQLMFKVGMSGAGRIFMSCRAAPRSVAPMSAWIPDAGPTDPHPPPHLREPLHDGRRGHPHVAADPGALVDHDDDAVCAFVAGASRICDASFPLGAG
jgi:hypothetical protein